MDMETTPRRIKLNRIKVDVKNELAEYRDATAAFWRRLRFYSIIIIYYQIHHVFCRVREKEGEHTSMSETDITILFGGGEIEIGNAVPLSARRKSIRRNETEQKAVFFFPLARQFKLLNLF